MPSDVLLLHQRPPTCCRQWMMLTVCVWLEAHYLQVCLWCASCSIAVQLPHLLDTGSPYLINLSVDSISSSGAFPATSLPSRPHWTLVQWAHGSCWHMRYCSTCWCLPITSYPFWNLNCAIFKFNLHFNSMQAIAVDLAADYSRKYTTRLWWWGRQGHSCRLALTALLPYQRVCLHYKDLCELRKISAESPRLSRPSPMYLCQSTWWWQQWER